MRFYSVAKWHLLGVLVAMATGLFLTTTRARVMMAEDMYDMMPPQTPQFQRANVYNAPDQLYRVLRRFHSPPERPALAQNFQRALLSSRFRTSHKRHFGLDIPDVIASDSPNVLYDSLKDRLQKAG